MYIELIAAEISSNTIVAVARSSILDSKSQLRAGIEIQELSGPKAMKVTELGSVGSFEVGTECSRFEIREKSSTSKFAQSVQLGKEISKLLLGKLGP